MHDKLTTPLALALTAVLLACISLIPAKGDTATKAPVEPLPVWLAQLPLEDDTQRLAVLIAVKLSARALDAVVAELEPETAEPPDTLAPRRGKPFRHLTPFYSFASAQPRPQGA
jgi:hypothetical protein